ncbi:MAG: hypothetical protein JWM75_248, partial [Sphingomonas bacterium]|nr:hypothetical protein [Sphingomonas bacterium]
AAARFAEAHAQAPAMESRVVRMATDNRCDPHEWLRLPDGRILKADALDHDAAHDLIGAQDLAWDVAGIAAEFDLDEDAMGQLVAATERAAGRAIDRALLGFLLPCYCAFRLGAAQLAADGLGGWTAEQARNRTAVARYAARLARLFG